MCCPSGHKRPRAASCVWCALRALRVTCLSLLNSSTTQTYTQCIWCMDNTHQERMRMLGGSGKSLSSCSQ